MPQRRKLPVIKKDRQSMEKSAHISTDIFLYGQTRWRMGVRPFRLLMMVCQAISSEQGQMPLFPEYVFPLDKVFKYLGLENTNQRYDLLAEDLKEFLSSCVENKTYTKRGARRWVGTSFITWYQLDEEDPLLRVQINENARSYFIGMKRWCSMQPKFYLKLSTEYQNWFYTFLRKELNLQTQITVEIDVLKEMLYLDKTASYDLKKNPNANDNFFKYVIGIQKPKDWKYTKNGKNKAWEYTKNKNGEFSGTLAGITQYTDMNVTAYPIKTGRSYTAITFEISAKAKFLSDTMKERVIQQNNKYATQDFGEPSRGRRSNKIQTIGDLFANTPVIQPEDNPVINQETIPTGKTVIPANTVRQMAKLQDTRPDILAKKLGYTLREDGNYEK